MALRTHQACCGQKILVAYISRLNWLHSLELRNNWLQLAALVTQCDVLHILHCYNSYSGYSIETVSYIGYAKCFSEDFYTAATVTVVSYHCKEVFRLTFICCNQLNSV